MDRFAAISAFVAVADHKGFAAAARKLGLSPSAATRLVAALETQLGVRLLHRTTRSLSLTDAGARFLARGREILSQLAEAERMAEEERGEPSGRIVVSAPLIFGRLHVAPLVCAFMNRHKRVRAELLLADRHAHLVEEGIDLAVRIGTLEDSGDVARRIGATRRVLVAAPDYLEKTGVPAQPEALAGHRLIAFSTLANPRAWRFGPAKSPQMVEIDPVYITNSADAAIWHAIQGGGIAMALSYQVIEPVRDGRLNVVLAEFEPEPLPIQFVYADSRLLSLKVRALIDQAVATCDWSFVTLERAEKR